jgi:hypothetical protein
MAHRLAWLYVHGKYPTDAIDHVNRERDDNRISNLRECQNWQNSANRSMRADNSSGIRGVHFSKKKKKWVAMIGDKGSRKYLGIYESKESAHQAYKAASETLYGEFSGELRNP